jgi:tRNA(Arg) A34 adenosine deaminase TadA
MHLQHLPIDLPAWAEAIESAAPRLPDDLDKMRLTIDLARRNVDNGLHGPFAAAVFERDSGRLLAVGVNSVVRLGNSALHAEMMAIMRAEHALGSYSLHAGEGEAGYELFASCEPCAMCLGGILWSRVGRVVCAAGAEAARAIGFDEGPVFPESYRYIEEAGIRVERGLLAEEANAVIRLYRERGGRIYNR